MNRLLPRTILALLALAAATSTAAIPADNGDGHAFAGTYLASLPTRAEILQLHGDGTAEITLSDQVTSGAGGLTFSDSLGSWEVAGPRTLTARYLNLNFAGTDFSGTAVVDYVYQFGADLRTIAASCQGKIFPPGSIRSTQAPSPSSPSTAATSPGTRTADYRADRDRR